LAEKEEQVPKYYANVVRLLTSINGTSILFARNVPAQAEGNQVDTESCCVVDLSPAQAKSLYLLLRSQLRRYEEQWGTIPAPPALAEEYGEAL
jgi:hypothetical protein